MELRLLHSLRFWGGFQPQHLLPPMAHGVGSDVGPEDLVPVHWQACACDARQSNQRLPLELYSHLGIHKGMGSNTLLSSMDAQVPYIKKFLKFDQRLVESTDTEGWLYYECRDWDTLFPPLKRELKGYGPKASGGLDCAKKEKPGKQYKDRKGPVERLRERGDPGDIWVSDQISVLYNSNSEAWVCVSIRGSTHK